MNHRLLRRQFSACALLLLALVLISPVAPTSSARSVPVFEKQVQTIQQARALPPARYIPDHDFDTRHLALDLRFDWEHEQLIGVETMVFRPLLANLQSIELDAADMTIASVKLVNGAPLKFEMNAEKQKLTIALGRSYQPAD
jgi:aminopeptidase N